MIAISFRHFYQETEMFNLISLLPFSMEVIHLELLSYLRCFIIESIGDSLEEEEARESVELLLLRLVRSDPCLEPRPLLE